jgi:hypothetical protein
VSVQCTAQRENEKKKEKGDENEVKEDIGNLFKIRYRRF